MTLLSGKFGTVKGLVRLTLDNLKFMSGLFNQYHQLQYGDVRRLVFVCHGNICRSPFGHYIALEKKLSVPVCSIGLLTTTGNSAYETAIDVAQDFSIDLSKHKATNITDFKILEGDLFLVMEDRHISLLNPFIEGKNVQVGLLGLWCTPRFPLLYDPHRLSREYFVSCFSRIKSATKNLAKNFKDKNQA